MREDQARKMRQVRREGREGGFITDLGRETATKTRKEGEGSVFEKIRNNNSLERNRKRGQW